MHKPTIDSPLADVLAHSGTVAAADMEIDLQHYENKLYWMFIPSHYSEVVAVLKQVVPLAFANREHEWEKMSPEERGRLWSDPRKSINFLDVGCGPGNIMAMAYAYGLAKYGNKKNREDNKTIQCYGIEHDVRLAKIASSIRIGTVFNQDALKFKDYNRFDIIYYYRPIKDKDMGKRLDERIRSLAKPGAIIIPNLPHEVRYKDNDIRLPKKDKKRTWPSCFDLQHTYQKRPL